MGKILSDDESFNVHNSNSPHHVSDINRNFENEILQENGNAQQIIRSSASPRADILSSSLEAEHRAALAQRQGCLSNIFFPIKGLGVDKIQGGDATRPVTKLMEYDTRGL
ncbi:hypothetical protein TURU_119756 [Turdus rufiventris]|nr:hypothetical protein TURU_119756 [Turdus rufiventris]